MTVEAVDKALDDVRPYLISDGGNVEVVAVEGGRVMLRLQACHSGGAGSRWGPLAQSARWQGTGRCPQRLLTRFLEMGRASSQPGMGCCSSRGLRPPLRRATAAPAPPPAPR